MSKGVTAAILAEAMAAGMNYHPSLSASSNNWPPIPRRVPNQRQKRIRDRRIGHNRLLRKKGGKR